MPPGATALLGLGLGGLYFMFEEAHRPPESNCSYLSPVTTDIMAFVGAGLILWRGVQKNDPLLTGIGGAIFGIHTGQVIHYKLTR